MIFFDLDECLFPFVDPCCRLFREQHGIAIYPHQVKTFVWHEIEGVGITPELWAKVLSEWTYDHPPIDGAMEAAHELAKLDEVVYVTARPTKATDQTREQLKAFPSGELVMVGKILDKMAEMEKRRKKHSMVVEDHAGAVEAFANMGLRVYAPRRFHNATLPDHPLITRVAGVHEVPELERQHRLRVSYEPS